MVQGKAHTSPSQPREHCCVSTETCYIPWGRRVAYGSQSSGRNEGGTDESQQGIGGSAWVPGGPPQHLRGLRVWQEGKGGVTEAPCTLEEAARGSVAWTQPTLQKHITNDRVGRCPVNKMLAGPTQGPVSESAASTQKPIIQGLRKCRQVDPASLAN